MFFSIIITKLTNRESKKKKKWIENKCMIQNKIKIKQVKKKLKFLNKEHKIKTQKKEKKKEHRLTSVSFRKR